MAPYVAQMASFTRKGYFGVPKFPEILFFRKTERNLRDEFSKLLNQDRACLVGEEWWLSVKSKKDRKELEKICLLDGGLAYRYALLAPD